MTLFVRDTAIGIERSRALGLASFTVGSSDPAVLVELERTGWVVREDEDADWREHLVRECDDVTAARICAGFTFRGFEFSLSLQAQANMLGATIAAESLPYPLAWGDRRDENVVLLDGPNDVREMYGAALARVATVRGEGLAAKVLVRSARDRSEAAAAVDYLRALP